MPSLLHIIRGRRARRPRGSLSAEVRFAPAGDLDLSSAARLKSQLTHALAAVAPGGRLVVDLRAVTFLDCSVLGEVVAVRNAATASGRSLVLTGARGPVRRVLDLTCVGDDRA